MRLLVAFCATVTTLMTLPVVAADLRALVVKHGCPPERARVSIVWEGGQRPARVHAWCQPEEED